MQERKAQNELALLKNMLTPTAKIYRNGKQETIDARMIQVGDTIIIGSGDRIPADGTLIESASLSVNEAILTGEAEPVEKSQESDSLVSMGTSVASGRGKFTVTEIGMQTKLGSIAQTLEQTKEEETPLQKELSTLASSLSKLVLVVCIGIFFIGILRGQHIVTMFSLAVAIAVSAIPEGMAVSLTVILSVGMQKILKRHAIVRRLVSAETLGSVSTLCIDKTGTLTEGIMKVTESKLSDKNLAILTSVYANNLENSVDRALWEWTQAQDSIDPQQLSDSCPRIDEIPFDGIKKYMVVHNAQGVWAKGAPDVLLQMTTLNKNEKDHWTKSIDSFARQGLRIIALAYKKPSEQNRVARSQYTEKLTFLGILGISDPIRTDVKDALSLCKNAGVNIKIITGDYRVTSEAILSKLGIDIHDASTEILEGKELADLTQDELTRRVKSVTLFCRITPDQKLKIVHALQQAGEVVGMTGDGVNDALALKIADIGIVVENASDVARETADLVLLDSNFHTIVSAIEEGRVMFHNIQKVVLYLLSDAFTEILLILAAIVASIPLPLTAIQILWINIISDGFPNLALACEPKEYAVMNHLPRNRTAPIVDTKIKRMVFVLSITKATIALILFLSYLHFTGNYIYAQTLTFAFVATGSLVYIFSTRNLSRGILKHALTKSAPASFCHCWFRP